MCVVLYLTFNILQTLGSCDKYYLRLRKRGRSERVEDALEAQDAGEDGQEGGEREDGQPQGVRQGHGRHGGCGGPQQHHAAHCNLSSFKQVQS